MMKSLSNISNILPFHQHMSDRCTHENNKGVFKNARPARPQPLGRAEHTEEYVSTAKGRPACAKPLSAFEAPSAKEARRRQGTPLVAFFNIPMNKRKLWSRLR